MRLVDGLLKGCYAGEGATLTWDLRRIRRRTLVLLPGHNSQQVATGSTSPHRHRVRRRSSAKKSSSCQLASLRLSLRRRTAPSLPRSSGATLFPGKLNSGLVSLIVSLRGGGFLNQLTKASSSPTGILANQTIINL